MTTIPTGAREALARHLGQMFIRIAELEEALAERKEDIAKRDVIIGNLRNRLDEVQKMLAPS